VGQGYKAHSVQRGGTVELTEYRQLYGGRDDAAPGWDAIQARLDEVYPGQVPKHWGTIIKHMLGGPDPLDGISAYECAEGGASHLHFCTYGFSSLYYDEESVGKEYSRFGFELTFRLAIALPPAEEPFWVLNLLQNLSRYVFESGRWFEAYHWIQANGPLRANHETDLVGLAFLPDPRLAPVETPHGRVEFLQAFGITTKELEQIKSKASTCERVVEENRKANPLLVTDLSRSGV
jgi:hypothetical protein